MSAPGPRAGQDVGERLYLPGDSPVHRLPATAKLVAALAFIGVVVATPASAGWPFAWYAALLAALVLVAGLPVARVLKRMTVEIPFVAFAVLLPFLGRPPSVEVAGLALSEPGLLAAWNILAKGTLGVATSVVLAATTRSRDLLDALAQLRVPALLVEIAGFMLRYIHVVSDEWRRMGMARAARGMRVTGPRSWPVLARSAGVLFIRSYERGERVHLAMQSRGYTGRMPFLGRDPVRPAQWMAALALPVGAAGALVAAVAG